MNKVNHPSNNGVLGAPVGWNQEDLPCDALPITRREVYGKRAVVSCWQPTPRELTALNEGKPLALFVIGDTMPPVLLTTDEI